MKPFPLKELFLSIIFISIYFANAQSGFDPDYEEEVLSEMNTTENEFEVEFLTTTLISEFRDKREANNDDKPKVVDPTLEAKINETTTIAIPTTSKANKTETTTIAIPTTSEFYKLEPTLNVYELTLNFLNTVKDSCEFLQHLSVVFENDHQRMKYFENIQMEFFNNLPVNKFLISTFTERHQAMKTSTNELWKLLNDPKGTENLKKFFLENFFKNNAMSLLNEVFDDNFMWTLKNVANMGLLNYSSGCETSTPNRMFSDFYIGSVFWVLKENALLNAAAEKIKSESGESKFLLLILF